jgi:hypothetical protein
MQRIHTILYLLTLLNAGCDTSAETSMVRIPDKAFLERLIATGVDRNGDRLISELEAEATLSLRIPPSGIGDLTGLEAFTSLDTLIITLNPLSNINLRENTALRVLELTSCELTNLDVSRNPELLELNCGRNLLTGLDLSGNLQLTTLILNNNLFTHLDLSSNGSLETMISCGNRLTKLDISMLPHLKMIGVDNMPMLTEVCVWNLPFPPEGVTVLRTYSPQVQFTVNCTADSH